MMKTITFLLALVLLNYSHAQQYLPLAQTYSGQLGKVGNIELVVYCTGYSDYGNGPSPSYQGKAIINNNTYTVQGTQRSDGNIQLDLNDSRNNTAYILETNAQKMHLNETLQGIVYQASIDGKKRGKFSLVKDIAKDDLYVNYFTATTSTGIELHAGFADFNGNTYLSLVPATTQDGIYGVYGKSSLGTETTKEFEELFCTYTFRWEDGKLELLIDNISGSSSCNPTFAKKEKLAFKKL